MAFRLLCPYGRRKPPPDNELERDVDDIKAQVLIQWHRIRRVIDELERLRGDADEERRSQTSVDRYRDEMPSETNSRFILQAFVSGS